MHKVILTNDYLLVELIFCNPEDLEHAKASSKIKEVLEQLKLIGVDEESALQAMKLRLILRSIPTVVK